MRSNSYLFIRKGRLILADVVRLRRMSSSSSASSSSSSLIESLSSAGRAGRRSVSFGGENEERVYDKRSNKPIASNEMSGSIIQSSVISGAPSSSRLKRTGVGGSRLSSSAALDHDVSYSSSSVDADIDYPYKPSHYIRGSNGHKERLDESSDDDADDSDDGDERGVDNDGEEDATMDDEENNEEDDGDEHSNSDSHSKSDMDEDNVTKSRQRRHYSSSRDDPHHHRGKDDEKLEDEDRHRRHRHGKDMDASEVTPTHRDLYAPLDKSQMKRKSAKMKRDVYRMEETVNDMISHYSPRKLATTPKGVSRLVDVAKLQLQERMNSVLAEQIVAMRESRSSSSPSTGGGDGKRRRDRDRLAYDEQTHSKPGGRARHSTLAMTGASGAKYSIRASGEKQYYH